ncbi:aminodeoxychorismate lyase [Methylicorpusculum oleiharenae]|uniref:aminodeoxychorismate lyase n=1 Tax=Methylicorpusculum oleiharenae TaxID=1338687 RepID=UPI00135A26EB|nr:aminodeoxychorismate lyase [Methylicorpusculum oleiharenae]MCD2453128.1 aminodeoxychorismate lyase [Methylicorpusculum oleiharenae]
MYLVNGQIKHEIAITDRGFSYGDGLFETIEIDHGIPVFFYRHLKRLTAGCQRLRIPLFETDQLIAEVKQALQGVEQGVLKIIITRGSGGRGYRQPDPVMPTRVISVHPFPGYPADFQTQGISLTYCETRLGLNPALAGIKHLNRLEQVLARAEWNSDAIHEGLMQDIQGHVIEGTMSNFFLVKGNRLITSFIDQCGVAGIMRSVVMECADELDMALSEQWIDKTDLLEADELFVCNSLIKIWPVSKLENRFYPVGPVTLAISRRVDIKRSREKNL